MAEPVAVPEFRAFSPTNRVDVLLADWKAELAPERTPQELEREVYGRALSEYLDGDYAFGLWCWFECDRLTNAFGGKVAEVTRLVGEGHYLGFSHRKAICERVPLDRVYQPRKGDMTTPRPEAVVLAPYQRLCVYAVRAAGGESKSKAQLEIALSELGERRRADPYLTHFETFRKLLERSQRAKAPGASGGPGGP
ncbi:MAG TPA: hypothetical protein VGS23_03905 [Thermoplasmata archaeon]|nr:hypothetical protein [Thermoplasmata archaeon]